MDRAEWTEEEGHQRGRICNLSKQERLPRKNRTRYDIEYEILEYCQSPKLETHIMYRANMSYQMLRKYLPDLMQRNLLEPRVNTDEGRIKYTTTPEGRKLMVAYLTLGINATKKNGGETI